MEHRYVSELLGAYVLSACDDMETARLEFHLSVCDECASEAGDLRDVVRRLSELNDMSDGPDRGSDPSGPWGSHG
jgi:anti-sigma factor RsiW